MTHLGISAAAVGLAAFASLSLLCPAHADTSATAPPSPASPSLSEPAPTPGWAESGPAASGGAAAQQPARASAHRHYPRHYAWRHGRREYSNPVGEVATGVVGGVADLGSIAAYPFYCFPNYGSCPMRLPYRP